MEYYSVRKQFLCPSFDPEVEEQAFLEKYYAFLDRSGVGNIIRKYVRNTGSSGGRPNVNYYNLFAVILYGFSRGHSTLRELEDACGHDIRYIAIMDQTHPSYTTFSNFIWNMRRRRESAVPTENPTTRRTMTPRPCA